MKPTRETSRGTLSVRADAPTAAPGQEIWITVVRPDGNDADMISISRDDARWLIQRLQEVLK